MIDKRHGLACALVELGLTGFNAHAAPTKANISSTAEITFEWDGSAGVNISATKDLSHVTVLYCNGVSMKYDDLEVGPEAFFEGEIHSVSVKAGTTEVLAMNTNGCPSSEEPPEENLR